MHTAFWELFISLTVPILAQPANSVCPVSFCLKKDNKDQYYHCSQQHQTEQLWGVWKLLSPQLYRPLHCPSLSAVLYFLHISLAVLLQMAPSHTEKLSDCNQARKLHDLCPLVIFILCDCKLQRIPSVTIKLALKNNLHVPGFHSSNDIFHVLTDLICWQKHIKVKLDEPEVRDHVI